MTQAEAKKKRPPRANPAMFFELPTKLKRDLKREAKRNGLPVAGYVRAVLIHEIRRKRVFPPTVPAQKSSYPPPRTSSAPPGASESQVVENE